MNKNHRFAKIYKYYDYILPLVMLVVVLLVNALFILIRGDSYIDSDMASNFVAADFYNSERAILSKDWYSSTGVEIFRDANIYQIMLLFIKNNWTLARAMGVFIMQIALVIEFLVFAKMIGIKRKNALLFSSFLISPLCYWLFLMIGFGAYYIHNTFFSMLAFIFVIWYTKLEENNKMKKVLCILGTIFTAIVSGINGIKSVIFPYGPLIVATVLLVFFALRENQNRIKERSCFEWKWVKISIISVLAFCCGYAINIFYISRNYYFESKSDISWASFNITKIFDGISDCLALLGYQNDEHLNWLMQGKMSRSIFSLQGIANLFGILLICYFMISILRLIGRFKSLTGIQKMVIYLFIGSIFVGTVILKFTQGYDTTPAYWVPVYPILLILMGMEYETEDYRIDITKKIIPFALTICVLITSFSTIKLYQESPLYADPQMVNIANWLEDNGYEKGYATFWQSNVITFLTDGKIEMWNVYGFDSLELNKWLQKKSHDEKPQGEHIFALIGPNDELDRTVFLQYMNTEPGIPEIVYSDDAGYIVVEYQK